MSRWEETIKQGGNEVETKKQYQNINEANSWFFEKTDIYIYKTDKFSTKLTERERRPK
jgi:hypothetical protein